MPSSSEASAAWRVFLCNWVVIGLLAAGLIVAALALGFSFKPASLVLAFAVAAAYLALAFYNIRRNGGTCSTIFFILGSTGQVLLIPILMTPMTYIAASANLPLQDAALAAWDRWLGLDWQAYYDYVSRHSWMVYGAFLSYAMIGWPVFGIPIVLGVTHRYRRMQEFTLAFAIALIVTTAITALVPAAAIYDEQFFANPGAPFTSTAFLDHLRDFPRVRDGSLRVLDMANLTGIVTFPSFHAATAVIYLWALWAVWWIRPVAVLANIGMLLATPYIGGHYFVDVFAGIAIAIAAIAAARLVSARLARPAPQPAATLVSGVLVSPTAPRSVSPA
jgi:membrane-associated phospholipid phosphatase